MHTMSHNGILTCMQRRLYRQVGKVGLNLVRFRSAAEAEAFCAAGAEAGGGGERRYRSRVGYVSDYLYGFNPSADPNGYAVKPGSGSPNNGERFFGMWIPGLSDHTRIPLLPSVLPPVARPHIARTHAHAPRACSALQMKVSPFLLHDECQHEQKKIGNGLNHRLEPNTVYRAAGGGTEEGINLVALTNIKSGEQLFDDYRRHGSAPQWALDFARCIQGTHTHTC